MIKKILFCSLIIFFNTAFLSNSFATETIKRNWKKSLNVYYTNEAEKTIKLLFDEWFKTTIKTKINNDSNHKIKQNLKTKTEGNSASIKYIIIYKSGNKIKYREYDPKIIFMSGTSTFKTQEDYKKKGTTIK